MLRYRYIALILILTSASLLTVAYYYAQLRKPPEKTYAGFWISGPGQGTPDYWVSLTKKVASSIPSSSPGNILIVGRIAYSPPGTCTLSFPSNQTYPHMFFAPDDVNENYLTAFDGNGTKICLEVEPGFADVNQLIDVVLTRYKHHPCVLGPAIDLEWRWGQGQTQETVPVTDEDANQWLNKIKSYNPDYKLFLIHWLTDVMPPTVRRDIVFIDDQQNFESLDSLKQEFKLWGESFSQTDVGYIFGYRRDLAWFLNLENPPREIASALIQNIPNCHFVFWSQETILRYFHPL